MEMTNRLLESILTRTEDGTKYIPVVPMTCEPNDDFTEVQHDFLTHRDMIRLQNASLSRHWTDRPPVESDG